MSLIFEALRNLEGQSQAAQAPHRRSAGSAAAPLPPLRARSALRWLLAAAVVALGGQLAWTHGVPAQFTVAPSTGGAGAMDAATGYREATPADAEPRDPHPVRSTPAAPAAVTTVVQPAPLHAVVLRTGKAAEVEATGQVSSTDTAGAAPPTRPAVAVAERAAAAPAPAVDAPNVAHAAPPAKATAQVVPQEVAVPSRSLPPGPATAAPTRDIQVKRERIARLTAALTRAVEIGDEIAVGQLLEELDSAAGADSNYAMNMRAFVALAHGRFAEVESLLVRVLARDEYNVNANLNLAVAESRTGRIQQARERLERLATTQPDDARIASLLRSMPPR